MGKTFKQNQELLNDSEDIFLNSSRQKFINRIKNWGRDDHYVFPKKRNVPKTQRIKSNPRTEKEWKAFKNKKIY